MAPDLSALPDDVDALRAIVAAQAAELLAKDSLIGTLRLQLARLRRMQFGRSSERLDNAIAQLELALEDLEAEAAGAGVAGAGSGMAEGNNAAGANGAGCPASKAKPARRPLPDHLPRDVVPHPPPSACPACGGSLRPLGEDATEVLDWVPGRFRVVRHVRPKCSCRRCEAICQAPPPSLPIRRGRAGPGLLAHVLVSKYADHLPLYRQAEIMAREGVELSRSTLADWVGQCADLLRPLVDALAKHVLEGGVLHADDTPVPVLAPGTGKTRTGQLWAYVRDERPWAGPAPPAVLYCYSPDRRGEHPRTHLAKFRGTLQADGYAGFGTLYEGGRVVEAACWAELPKVPRAEHVEWQRRGMSGAGSLNCTSPAQPRSPPRRSPASMLCMRLSTASLACLPTNGPSTARPEPGRCWTACTLGSQPRSPACRAAATWRAPSATRLAAGRH